MNERIKELMAEADRKCSETRSIYDEILAQLIVKEMCGLMEQAEDDAYHCFEPGERPTEYIEWLRDWQERFTKHFGVEE